MLWESDSQTISAIWAWRRNQRPWPVHVLRPLSNKSNWRLQKPVSWNFHETPLTKVAEVLSRHLGVSVRIAENSLKDAGLSTEMPVNLQLQNVSCETALNAALHSYNLDWFVEGETVVITTQDAANSYLVTRVYPVRDLVKSRLAQLRRRRRFVNQHPHFNGRRADLGPSRRSGEPQYFAPAGTLLISQTRVVHDQIGKLLAVLRQARDEQGLRRRWPASGSAAVGHGLSESPASTRQYAAAQAWNQPRVHQ